MVFNALDLSDYIKKIERQRSVLMLSLLFSDEEKEQISTIYDNLIAICCNAVAKSIEVNSPTHL